MEAESRTGSDIKTLLRPGELYRSVVENIPDIVFVADRDGTILFINRVLPGFTIEGTIGTKVYDHVPVECRRTMESHIKQVFETGRPSSYEVAGADGGTRWYSTRVGPIKRDGRVIAVVLTSTDVTERKRVEEALRESEERYRLLAENVSDVIWTTDMSLRFTYVSPSTQRLLGYTIEERMTKSTEEIIAPASLEIARRTLQEALKEELSGRGDPSKSRTLEMECVHKDGHSVWIEVTVSFLRDADGRPTGIVGTSRDITARKAAEAALRESEEKYRSVVENIPDVVCGVRRDGTLLFLNRTQSGYTPEQAVGNNIFDYLTGEHAETARRNIDRIFETGERVGFEVAGEVPGRGPVWFSVHGGAIKRDGEVVAATLVGRDVTERKRTEEELRRHRERLEEMVAEKTAELTAANERLRREIEERKWVEEAMRRSEREKLVILDSMSEQVAYLDTEMRVIWANRAAYDYAGVSPTLFTGRRCYELWYGRSAPCEDCPAVEAIRTGRPQEREVRDPKGKIWFSRAFPVRDESGRLLGVVEVALEVTEQKAAERALTAERDKLRALMDGLARMGIGINIVGGDHRILFQNEPLRKKFGDALGRLCHEVYMGSGSPCSDCPMARAVETNRVARAELTGADGRDYETISAPLPGPDGTVDRAVEVISDITERKRAEAALRSHQVRLRSLASELSLAEERERRRIATDLHDNIGQILAMSKIRLDAMREAAAASGLSAPLDEIRALIERSVRYTRSLTSELSPPVLYELGFVKAVEWLLERNREEYGIESELVDDGGPKPLADDVRVLLFKAVRELLVNIVKHARARRARVSIRRRGGSVEVEVCDDGVGFDPSGLWSAAGRTGGFGLFNIRERLDHIGGGISIESGPGRGTRVTLTAPLAPESVSAVEDAG